MKISNPTETRTVNEIQLLLETLDLKGAHVLELGCGKAEKTRTLAADGRIMQITALEVDQVQHARNLAITDLPKVSFVLGGAESIPADDNHFDLVLMFKSLHHVPLDQMANALKEITRVLKPGGSAWISEPVYAGELNEVFRLFHDEKMVREAAFAAVCHAVDSGLLTLGQQLFFNTRSHFDSFAQFDQRMIQVTHTQHQLPEALYAQVREKFSSYLGPDGATFFNPQRVDHLLKPTTA